jgi:phage repressor protein C with HTH and peptisase S24 domain
MPNAAAISGTRVGRFSVVQIDGPTRGLVKIGVLLEDPESDTLLLRLRRDLESLLGDEGDEEYQEDREILESLAEDLAAKAREMGAAKLFEYLESTLSGSIRITDREEIQVDDFPRALNRLYLQNVQSNVVEFRTHLPRYSLKAAAGVALENAAVEALGWIETPEDLRLTKDMFVAQIAGHSMEPLIPDGALCVFRYGVVGSRIGRLVLAEERATGGNDRYAVKRYHRDPQDPERRITLESLNRDYPNWELEPDPDSDQARYRILAEFVRVLD